MLNGDDNENGFNTNRSNQQINKLHVQHALLSFPCRCFARLQRCFVRLKRKTSQYTPFLWRNCRMCLPNIFFTVFMFRAFIFHCRSFSTCWPLAFLIFSEFPCFCPTKFVCFVFNNSLKLFLCCPRQSKHKKITPKKTRLCCCFFFLKVRAAI